MYVYYEHHRDASGKIVLTELRLSSDRNGRLEIHFWNNTEKMVFEAVKPLLKWCNLQYYSYDPNTKIWSYFGQYGVKSTYGEETIKKIQTVVEALMQPFKAFEIEDLADQAVNDRVDLSGKRRAPKLTAEEFFYNHGVAQPVPTLSVEQIKIKLTTIVGSDVLDKKSYRLAALRLHPDRNNGDGSKMSELNMLWQQWNALQAREVQSA